MIEDISNAGGKSSWYDQALVIVQTKHVVTTATRRFFFTGHGVYLKTSPSTTRPLLQHIDYGKPRARLVGLRISVNRQSEKQQ